MPSGLIGSIIIVEYKAYNSRGMHYDYARCGDAGGDMGQFSRGGHKDVRIAYTGRYDYKHAHLSLIG